MDEKKQWLDLIRSVPSCEGMTFEEALAEHLIQSGAKLPVRLSKNTNGIPPRKPMEGYCFEDGF